MSYLEFFPYSGRVRLCDEDDFDMVSSLKRLVKPTKFKLNIESDFICEYTIQQEREGSPVYIYENANLVAEVNLQYILLEGVRFSRVYGDWKNNDKWKILGKTLMEYSNKEGYKQNNGSLATILRKKTTSLLEQLINKLIGKQVPIYKEESIRVEFAHQSFNVLLAFCIMGITIINYQLKD